MPCRRKPRPEPKLKPKPKPKPGWCPPSSNSDIAWAAGFFDAEGCTSVKRSNGHLYPQIVIGQKDPTILRLWLKRMNRPGKVYQTSGIQHLGTHSGQRQIRYQISISGIKAELIIECLWPWLCETKREQARQVLSRCGETLDLKDVSRTVKTEQAWAAGFFEGDGSIFRGKQGNFISLSAYQNHPEPLLRLGEAVGHGAVCGPYTQPALSGGVRSKYDFSIQARQEVLESVLVMWPWLGASKRKKFSQVVNELPENKQMYWLEGMSVIVDGRRRFYLN